MTTTSAATAAATPPTTAADLDPAHHNEVRLRGRVSGAPERRVLPSGDEVVALRLVVQRPGDATVDTLPLSVGPGPAPGRRPGPGQVGRRTLADAERLVSGAQVEVAGRLQRRWWDAGGARRSRVEVRVEQVTALADPPAPPAGT